MIIDSTKNVIYIVGLGPGDTRFLTEEARRVLEASDVIVGYNVYVDLIRDS
ncbi:MAG: precorrin-3B C(17)-methyltransferase, partial [Eubacterium sp.]|nr:precorrin-3B C(17)-methyltransferase [Eubacterium sp.]